MKGESETGGQEGAARLSACRRLSFRGSSVPRGWTLGCPPRVEHVTPASRREAPSGDEAVCTHVSTGSHSVPAEICRACDHRYFDEHAVGKHTLPAVRPSFNAPPPSQAHAASLTAPLFQISD
eukprot:364034-Chlamydomonas_euryale.AAC.7